MQPVFACINNLHKLVLSRLYINGFERQLAQIKRCGELLSFDSEFRKRFVSDSDSAIREVALDVEPKDILNLFVNNFRTICRSDLSEAGNLYYSFCKDSMAYIPSSRNWCSKNPQLNDWRLAQISRCNCELGSVGHKLAHLPIAFELSSGCSVGCWFCGLSAGRITGIFRYTDSNTALWKQCLRYIHMFLGEDVEAPICYYATEPLDNPDLPQFMRDYFLEFNAIPQLTTAVPTRNSDFTKHVLNELRNQQLTLHRFSITSLNQFRDVMDTFTPEELLDVVLMPRFRECQNSKLINVGNAYNETEKIEKRGTIACVTGFVINMENRSVRLVTPTCACKEFPNGEIIVGEQQFDDAYDLERKIHNMIMKLK